MKVTTLNSKTELRFALISLITVFLFFVSGCKEEEADISADFSFEYLNDNYVQFRNQSQGEYYSMIWNFGNGQADTTTDKKKIYVIYYPEAGNYQVVLRLTNYTGGNESISKTINIANNNLLLSFTTEIDPINPNYVKLINTTQGTYDSFKWLYRNIEVEDEMEHLAYFPTSGDYEVELFVSVNNKNYSLKQTVTYCTG